MSVLYINFSIQEEKVIMHGDIPKPFSKATVALTFSGAYLYTNDFLN